MTTVLIIRDEKDLVQLIRRKLEREGYKVISAFDAESGLTMARIRIPP